MKKDLLSIDDLTSDEIYLILDTAEAMREIGQRPIKKVPTLRGKTDRQPVLRAEHADAHVVRDRREAARAPTR